MKLTYEAPNIRSTEFHVLFHCLSPTKVLDQVWDTCVYFLTIPFLRWVVVSTSPNQQAGLPPLFVCPWVLIQYIRRYPPYFRPFLHPQPEDAPCRGDRNPLIMELKIPYYVYFQTHSHTTHSLCLFYRQHTSAPFWAITSLFLRILIELVWSYIILKYVHWKCT